MNTHAHSRVHNAHSFRYPVKFAWTTREYAHKYFNVNDAEDDGVTDEGDDVNDHEVDVINDSGGSDETTEATPDENGNVDYADLILLKPYDEQKTVRGGVA